MSLFRFYNEEDIESNDFSSEMNSLRATENNYSLEEILQLNVVRNILDQKNFDNDLSEFETLSKLKLREKEILKNITNFVTYYFDVLSKKKLSFKKSIRPNIWNEMPRNDLLTKSAFIEDEDSHERKYAVWAMRMLEDNCSQLDVIIHLVYGGLLSLIEQAVEKIERDEKVQNFFLKSVGKNTNATHTETIDVPQQIKFEDGVTQTESTLFGPPQIKCEDIAIQTEVYEIRQDTINNKEINLSHSVNETSSRGSSNAILTKKSVSYSYKMPRKKSLQLPFTLHFSKMDPLRKKEISTCYHNSFKIYLKNESHPVPSDLFPNPFYVMPLTPEIKQRLSQGEVIKDLTIPEEVLKVGLKRKLIVLPTRKYNIKRKKQNNEENNCFALDNNQDGFHSTVVPSPNMLSSHSNMIQNSKNYSKDFRKI